MGAPGPTKTPINASAGIPCEALKPSPGPLLIVMMHPPSGDGPLQMPPVYEVEPVAENVSVRPAVTFTSTGEFVGATSFPPLVVSGKNEPSGWPASQMSFYRLSVL